MAQCAFNGFYNARRGDTCDTLATKFSIPLKALLAMNPGLQHGEKQLQAPDKDEAGVSPADGPSGGVVRGAVMAGPAFTAQGPACDALPVGLPLCVKLEPVQRSVDDPVDPVFGPDKMPCGASYKIAPGDTCDRIAKHFGLTTEELRGLNLGLAPDCSNLVVGRSLCVLQAGVGMDAQDDASNGDRPAPQVSGGGGNQRPVGSSEDASAAASDDTSGVTVGLVLLGAAGFVAWRKRGACLKRAGSSDLAPGAMEAGSGVSGGGSRHLPMGVLVWPKKAQHATACSSSNGCTDADSAEGIVRVLQQLGGSPMIGGGAGPGGAPMHHRSRSGSMLSGHALDLYGSNGTASGVVGSVSAMAAMDRSELRADLARAGGFYPEVRVVR